MRSLLVSLPAAERAGRPPTRYEDDPYTWALEQAVLLRDGAVDRIDAKNLADEIMDVAHYLADKLESDLARVLQHLLKWDNQPERRSRSWALSVAEHRRRIGRHLTRAPGLTSVLADLVKDAYEAGRNAALKETDLPDNALPMACPYDWDAIMTRPIVWPSVS